MKKRVMFMLLAVVMLISLLPVQTKAATVASGYCGKDVMWVLDSNGKLSIMGTGDMYDYSMSSRAPWYADRWSIKSVIVYDVTRIGAYAFYGCDLTQITIDNSVGSIGSFAFGNCYKLRDIYIYDLNAWLGISCKGAFSRPNTADSNGKKLYLKGKLQTELVIPEGVKAIRSNAFRDFECIQSVTIPDSVTSIGEYAFAECVGLTSVTLGEGVVSIGAYAFQTCKQLDEILIPSSVTSIAEYAFYDGYRARNLRLEDVYYGGDAGMWDSLSNKPATNRIHYSCAEMETHWKTETMDATCEENGYTYENCACGLSRNKKYTENATGHSYQNGKCINCGKRDENYFPGDMDFDGQVNVDDVLTLLWNVLFPEDYPIEAEADFDGNGETDVDDVLTLLWHVLFPDDYPLN